MLKHIVAAAVKSPIVFIMKNLLLLILIKIVEAIYAIQLSFGVRGRWIIPATQLRTMGYELTPIDGSVRQKLDQLVYVMRALKASTLSHYRPEYAPILIGWKPCQPFEQAPKERRIFVANQYANFLNRRPVTFQ